MRLGPAGRRVVETLQEIAALTKPAYRLGQTRPGRRGGWQVAGEIDRSFARSHVRAAPGRARDKAAPADVGGHQSQGFGGRIGLGHGADADPEQFGQPPVGGQLRARRQQAARHVGLKRRGDAFMDVASIRLDPGSPFRHCAPHIVSVTI